MGRQRNEPAPQLALEAVHDGDDRDQRSHTEADAEHRDPADERHEETAAAGTDVSQPEENG